MRGHVSAGFFRSDVLFLQGKRSGFRHIVASNGAKAGRARSNDLAGRSTALAPPCLLLCFICFILTVKQSAALTACVLRATTKKVANFVWGKKCIRWPGLRIFWPRNDLAALTSWRRQWLLQVRMVNFFEYVANLLPIQKSLCRWKPNKINVDVHFFKTHQCSHYEPIIYRNL